MAEQDQTDQNQTEPGKEEGGQAESAQTSSRARKPRRQKAVIDRIEEGKWAVLLVGHKEVEHVVPLEELPEGLRSGTWLKVRLTKEKVEDVEVDEAETAKTRGRIESKLAQLRGRQSKLKPISAADAQDGPNRLRGSRLKRVNTEADAREDDDELEEWVDEGGAPSDAETGEE